ncbi:MAG: hypothetical protein COB85_05920 [Bacteroidetes bacterium]|nr:MAG: hypothetical protein COB85_05920 [Bacteroidota bacterium]
MKNIILFIPLFLIGLTGFGQENDVATESAFTVEKENKVKILMPGTGTLKGTVYVLNEKNVIPLAFIDIKNGKQLQANKDGYFEVEVDTGNYEISITSAGYKDLIIKDFRIKWGKELTLKVSLANEKGLRKN